MQCDDDGRLIDGSVEHEEKERERSMLTAHMVVYSVAAKVCELSSEDPHAYMDASILSYSIAVPRLLSDLVMIGFP
jgi:hypothetical protein